MLVKQKSASKNVSVTLYLIMPDGILQCPTLYLGEVVRTVSVLLKSRTAGQPVL